LIGEIMLKRGDLKSGFDYIERATASSSDIGMVEGLSHQKTAALFLSLARNRVESEGYDAAVIGYKQVLRSMPGDQRAINELKSIAGILEQKDRYKEAADILKLPQFQSALRDRIHKMALHLLADDMDEFSLDVEKIMLSLGLDANREIFSADDLARLLLQIAEAIPERPDRREMIFMIRRCVLHLNPR